MLLNAASLNAVSLDAASTIAVKEDSVTQWDAQSYVTAGLSAPYDMGGPTRVNLNQPYDVRNILGKSVSMQYDATNYVDASQSTSWDDRMWVSRSGIDRKGHFNGAPFNVLAFNSRKTALNGALRIKPMYDVRGALGNNQATQWNVRQFAEADLVSVYDVTSYMTGGGSFSWDVRKYTDPTEQSVQYDVTELLASDATSSLQWSIREFVTQTSAEQYDVRQWAEADLVSSWDMSGKVIAPISTQWDVRTHTVTHSYVVYDLTVRAGEAGFATQYDVRFSLDSIRGELVNGDVFSGVTVVPSGAGVTPIALESLLTEIVAAGSLNRINTGSSLTAIQSLNGLSNIATGSGLTEITGASSITGFFKYGGEIEVTPETTTSSVN